MGYRIAIVGATGNVGREVLSILAERDFPADDVVALASRRSQGTEVSFGDKTLKVKALDNYDFSNTDIAIRNPCPGSPIKASAGTRHSSNRNLANGCGAIVCNRSTTSNPG